MTAAISPGFDEVPSSLPFFRSNVIIDLGGDHSTPTPHHPEALVGWQASRDTA